MSNVIKLRNKRRKKNSIAKYLLFVACSLGVLLILLARIFTIEDIEIEGNTLYSDEEIIDILNIGKKSNIINVYMNMHKSFSDYPYIDHVELEYIGYNKIKIEVHEKQIIGYIFYMSKYLSIDKDGYIVDYVDEAKLEDSIAIIEGLPSDSLVMGEKINLQQQMIDACLTFNQAEKKYGLDIDILTFEEGSLERIFLDIGNITIVFGNMNEFNQKIQFVKNMLSEISDGESGTLYLEDNGRMGYYEKNED